MSRKHFYLEWLNQRRPKDVPKPVFVGPRVTPYVFLAPDRQDVRQMRAASEAAPTVDGQGEGKSATRGAERQDVRDTRADATGVADGVEAGTAGAEALEAAAAGVGAAGAEAAGQGVAGAGAAEAAIAEAAVEGSAVQAAPSAIPQSAEQESGCLGTQGATTAPCQGTEGDGATSESRQGAASLLSGSTQGGAASGQRGREEGDAPFQVNAGSFQCVW